MLLTRRRQERVAVAAGLDVVRLHGEESVSNLLAEVFTRTQAENSKTNTLYKEGTSIHNMFDKQYRHHIKNNICSCAL